MTQKITLDDDPDVFSTYAAWLFEHEITQKNLEGIADNLEHHFFYVYIFADKRGIRALANDIITMMSSFWVAEPIELSITAECLPLLPPQCTLYELTLDNLVLVSRQAVWDADDWETLGGHTKEIILELFKREQTFSSSFKDYSNCFETICHYHKHEDAAEKSECIRRVESGRNIFTYHEGPWDQIERRW